MQVVFVILLISAAVFYLGRQLYMRFFAKETNCEGCAVGKSLGKE